MAHHQRPASRSSGKIIRRPRRFRFAAPFVLLALIAGSILLTRTLVLGSWTGQSEEPLGEAHTFFSPT